MNRWSSSCTARLSAAIVFAAGLSLAPRALAAIVVIDDFELDEGHFGSNPNTASGTSQGFVKAIPNTTADRVTTDFFDGIASQLIILDDDPNVPGSPAPNSVDSWRLRHLSGGGTIGNNLPLAAAVGETSYVGYWLKTTTIGLEASIGIDDSATALEIGRWQPIIPDGQWHLYEWLFQDPNDWEPFALVDANGTINSTAVTIDSLFFRGGVGAPTGLDVNASFFIDRVAYNPTGSLVPEPGSAILAGVAGLILAGSRRRDRKQS